MLSLVAVLVFLLIPLFMLVFHLLRPKFQFHWLIAALGGLAAWLLMVLGRLRLPQTISLSIWKPAADLPFSLSLLADGISWPFGMAVATLVVAVILSVPARRQPGNWRAWAGSLALGGGGLLAVLAGNTLTLIIAWAILDILELLILLAQVKESAVHERAVLLFAERAGGLALLVWAGVTAQATGAPLSFIAIPQRAIPFLLLAAGLRLGVLPPHMPFIRELPSPQGIEMILRLIPASSSLMLLGRIALVGANLGSGISTVFGMVLLILAALAAVIGGTFWVAAPDAPRGLPFWRLGIAALAVAAAVQNQSAASMAWGLAGLLSGGLLYLFSVRTRPLLLLPLFGVLGFSALPFTPAWAGMRGLLMPTSIPVTPLLLLAHALLLWGYVRHARLPGESLEGVERWVWVLYPLGLALLPLIHLWTQLPDFDEGRLFFYGWWLGALPLGLAGLFWFWAQRGPRLPKRVRPILEGTLSMSWFYRPVQSLYEAVGQLIGWLSRVFEGEGGILWALVFLAMLATILARWLGG
jgi:hypothetical protein